MKDELVLPRRQQELYDLLKGKGDVQIVALYAAMGAPLEHVDDIQFQQRWLGPYISKLNRRLKNRKLRVQPGKARRSYRIAAST